MDSDTVESEGHEDADIEISLGKVAEREADEEHLLASGDIDGGRNAAVKTSATTTAGCFFFRRDFGEVNEHLDVFI